MIVIQTASPWLTSAFPSSSQLLLNPSSLHLNPNAHNRQNNFQGPPKPPCLCLNGWIRKLWCIYTMEYYSAIKKNTFKSVLMRWMKLEPTIQSEVRKKSTDTGTMTLYARQPKRKDFWTLWEKGRVRWFERIALKHVHCHMWNRWPVQVQCMKQVTQSRCSGTTQRHGVGREVGRGFRMGDTGAPMGDSCRCMAKTTIL